MVDEIFELYEIKCRKYKPEQLTERLKGVLFSEAARELSFMEYINSKGVQADG